MAKKSDAPRRGRRTSQDEAALFRHAMRGTTPMDDRIRSAPNDENVDRSTPNPAPRFPARSTPVPSSPARQLPELSSGDATGLDRRTMDRLRRGQMRPEARLDLHGHTQDEAQSALIDFLRRAQGAGKRCVIVITGRGRMGQGGGVLRSQTPRWLNLPSLRPLVLGFAVAQPKDGGTGALYVLLKKRKR
jgi:DNA-nicking Smr family endonuclease